ncbi:MAG: hypothetical protein JSU96_00280 [Acidobacteriota bacterium]|nr:MAG: hypothetical protein JSU96_00280 [Acidobacteriota bacterium]
MRSRRLFAILRMLHRSQGEDNTRFYSELEADLLRRHSELWGSRRRVGGRLSWLRPLPVSAALLALLGGAAWIPVTVSLDLGFLINVQGPPDVLQGLTPASLVGVLEEKKVAESVSVSVSQGDREARMLILLLGEQTEPALAMQEIRRVMPQLEEADFETDRLRGNLRTSLARRIGHNWLAIDMRSLDLDAARLKVLEALGARGYSSPQVGVLEQEEHREITIELE